MNVSRWIWLGVLALAPGCAETGGAALANGSIEPGAPSPARAERAFSETDCALLAAYRSALAEPGVREASRKEILRQVRRIPPVARVGDYRVSPFDFGGLLTLPEVEAAVRSRLSDAGVASAGTVRLGPGGTGERRDLLALAFTATRWRGELSLPYVGELREPAPAPEGRADLLIVPVRDVEAGLIEYLPPPPSEGEDECYYFCGDPETWDFDGDGMVNRADPDDDGDGVPDGEDDYPYWPRSSDCSCEEDFIGLTGKFSEQVTAAVLWASRVGLREGSERSVSLGSVAQDRGTVAVVFPDDDMCPGSAETCPDPTDPQVSYVSRDPADCAVVRFRCEAGQVPFSNDCGCGCLPE